MVEQTLSIIKPNGVKKNVMGKVIDRFESQGLRVAAAKLVTLTKEVAEGFYAEHQGKPFFGELVGFMTSGPVLLMVLEGPNAIQMNRDIMGATDPKKAAPGTIRFDFADSMTENTVHGSDGTNSAHREIRYFFEPRELVNTNHR